MKPQHSHPLPISGGEYSVVDGKLVQTDVPEPEQTESPVGETPSADEPSASRAARRRHTTQE